MLWPHPTSWWPRPICETALNDESKKQAVQQRPKLPFVWKLSQLRRCQDCRSGWETGTLDSALPISTLTTSECLTDSLVFCIVVGFLFLYSNHLEGRPTVENDLVHIGTNLYWRTHVMTSSISVLVHFFCGFYFRRSRSVRENRENLHPAKISRYTVFDLPWYISTNYEHSLRLLTLQTTLPGAQAPVGYCYFISLLVQHVYNYRRSTSHSLCSLTLQKNLPEAR